MPQKVFVSYPELSEHGVRFSRKHIYELMATRRFPLAYKLSTHRIGWDLAEVEAWKDSRQRIVLAGMQVPWTPDPTVENESGPGWSDPPPSPVKRRGRRAGSRVVVDELGNKRVVPPPLDRPKPDEEAAEPPIAAE